MGNGFRDRLAAGHGKARRGRRPRGWRSGIVTGRPVLRRALFALGLVIVVWFLYVLFAGGFVFAWNPVEPLTPEEAAAYRSELRDGALEANVALVEDNTFAGLARVDLLRRANETLEISSHQITGGKAADLFFAEVLAAAERGVSVRIILDGMFEGMRRLDDDLAQTVRAHPNIRIAFYEPLSILKPWTIQNRFHDKMIVVDGAMLLTGGRNIGSRYFLYEIDDNSRFTQLRDRDVLVFSKEGPGDVTLEPPVAVSEAREYFETVWAHEWTHEQEGADRDDPVADSAAAHISWAQDIVNEVTAESNELPVDWADRAIAADTVRFFTNPLERMNKTPTVFRKLSAFLDGAQEEAWIQSPFIVTNSNMETILGEFPRENQVLLTNSPATNPNWFAASGYLNQRTDFAGNSRALYEYQGDGSIHAKAWLIDGRYSFIGAFNMDPRSAFLSTESMLFIESEAFGDKHRQAMERLADRSLAMRSTNGDLVAVPREGVDMYEAGWVKRVALRIMSLFARPLAFLL